MAITVQPATKKTIWGIAVRPLLAYYSACLISVALIGEAYSIRHHEPDLLSGTFDYVFAVFWFAGILFAYTIIPSSILMLVIKSIRFQRGSADIVAGALMGLSFPLWILYPTHMSSQEMLITIGIGAIAGFTYWLVNGRPRATPRT